MSRLYDLRRWKRERRAFLARNQAPGGINSPQSGQAATDAQGLRTQLRLKI